MELDRMHTKAIVELKLLLQKVDKLEKFRALSQSNTAQAWMNEEFTHISSNQNLYLRYCAAWFRMNCFIAAPFRPYRILKVRLIGGLLFRISIWLTIYLAAQALQNRWWEPGECSSCNGDFYFYLDFDLLIRLLRLLFFEVLFEFIFEGRTRIGVFLNWAGIISLTELIRFLCMG